MVSLNKKFQKFSDLFNQFYETACLGYPPHPKFSVWRLMIKKWVSIVFKHNHENIVKGFIKILA